MTPRPATGAPDGATVGATDGAADPGGPLVVVCTGHRCAALRRLDGEDDAVGASLRGAVRGGSGGVLVASPCVGGCSRAPVAAVGRRRPDGERPASTVWLGDLDAGRRAALAAWVASGGALQEVPAALRAAVLAVRGAPGRTTAAS